MTSSLFYLIIALTLNEGTSHDTMELLKLPYRSICPAGLQVSSRFLANVQRTEFTILCSNSISFLNFFIHRAFYDFVKVYQFQEQLSGPSEAYHFQYNPKEYLNDLSEVYRKQNEQKNGLSQNMIISLRGQWL